MIFPKRYLDLWIGDIRVLAALLTIFLTNPVNGQKLTIAYIHHGNVWMRSGQEPAHQLSFTGIESRPKFSWDGNFLAFLSGDKLQIASVLQSKLINVPQIAGINSFTWSKDQNRIIFWSDEQLFVATEQGAWIPAKILDESSPAGRIEDALFFPDGKEVALALRNISRRPQPDEELIEKIPLEDPHSNLLLASIPVTGIHFYGFDRNGSHLIFWKIPNYSSSIENDGVYLYTLGITKLRIEPFFNFKTLAHREDISESSSGEYFAASVVSSQLGRETWGPRPMVLGIVKGMKVTTTIPDRYSTSTPRFSPDGKTIAFVRAPRGLSNIHKRKIWLVESDGTHLRQLTRDVHYRDEYPIWSAKSSLLFSRIDRFEHFSIWSSVFNERPVKIADVSANNPSIKENHGYVEWPLYFDVRIFPSPDCDCNKHPTD